MMRRFVLMWLKVLNVAVLIRLWMWLAEVRHHFLLVVGSPTALILAWRTVLLLSLHLVLLCCSLLVEPILLLLVVSAHHLLLTVDEHLLLIWPARMMHNLLLLHLLLLLKAATVVTAATTRRHHHSCLLVTRVLTITTHHCTTALGATRTDTTWTNATSTLMIDHLLLLRLLTWMTKGCGTTGTVHIVTTIY